MKKQQGNTVETGRKSQQKITSLNNDLKKKTSDCTKIKKWKKENRYAG
jgi:hypothetical protein